MEMNMKKIIAYVHIGDYGQAVDNIKFITDNEIIMSHVSVDIEGHFCDLSGKALSKGVLSVEQTEGCVVAAFDPFLYRYDFRITGKIGGEDIEVTKDNIDEVVVKDLDTFTARKENGVIYRLYEPEAAAARPLVLFLHGGGECGEDNVLQMTGTLGALRLAEKWPDMYIMAPQAPAGSLTMQENFEVMRKRGNPFRVEMGMTPFALKGERGWNRDYLGKVTDIIRRMIEEGKVDAKRVYVIGMSMGGGGTINAVSTAPDLFAAALPICPSMNGESYPQLLHWPKVPVWISTAYMDHQHGRHAYILNACNKLWGEGRTDVKYTMYLPEELEKYGIGSTEGINDKELDAENHNSWILTLHNENGILDWMISHVKE
ncbi:prolyl oligopeptidase family serine peptidase [Eubacterium sp. BIOML-A1]|nr:prolyl oligopeptidase family serine peptidase [Eubacterium sp. BIOML-A1]MSD06398.1 prolyl oligopeptidase family serine peptidase [Eubacterium sp. BIOML-A2]